MSGLFGVPLGVISDSYKATHYALYPPTDKMVAYGEFRSPYDHDKSDERIVLYGIRHIIEDYVAKKWTLADVELAEKFYQTHNAGNTPYPFPKELFAKFVKENDGWFPVKIEALPDGMVIFPHVPVYQITAEKEYSRLVTWLETVMTMVWYPTSVATLSRRCKNVIELYFKETVDEDGMWTLNSRLHDFGFRGCTTIEQGVIGGSAHLLNFEGSDTMPACFYAQFHINNGKPVATSIPATEHSVMTAWPTERDALLREIDQFGSGVIACVMDSYDYTAALEKVLPSIAKKKLEKGGFLVLRPDSGDIVEVVIQGLRAADKVFGSTVNKKGYKVITGASVIQGDGVTPPVLQQVLEAVKAAGYSAQNVAFGMGGGLLQKLNRDTLGFATKLSQIVYSDSGRVRNVMKTPKTDSGKISLPGVFAVVPNDKGIPIVYPKDTLTKEQASKNLLQVVYDKGIKAKWDDFETMKQRIERQWHSLPTSTDTQSPALKELIKETIAEHKMDEENAAKMLE